MCGICGLAALDGTGPVDPAALAAMNAALVHRGPDEEGTARVGPVGLAARRLSIIDVEGGHQPVHTEDGRVVLVQNGEIYNHAELREELRGRGHVFSTRSDTEVLAHLYEEEGLGFLDRLRGMFALALWDTARERLVLARDAFGIKPLYWGKVGPWVAWASELGALRRLPGCPGEVDLDALEAYLAFNSVPAPHSILTQIAKLPPGHLLVWEPGGEPWVERWARPAPAPPRTEPFAVLVDEARERLRDSVRAHLVSDVPVGVLLSGGVDSGTLAALAAEEGSGRLQTFSVGFEEKSFDELEDARSVAERYDTDHHEIVLRAADAELLPDVLGAFDEPFADSSALPTWFVSRLAADHVKVVLSGEGGDELFGGYETYVADLLAERTGRLAHLVAPLVERLPSSSARVSLDYKAKRFVRSAHLGPLERHHGWKEIFSSDARAALLDGRRGTADPVDLLRARWEETRGAPLLARLQDVDRTTYLVDDLLVKTDRASMAHSLEARVPFLDPRVAELALALPTAYKVRGTTKKRLLRAAAEPLVGAGIARGRKRGFSIPAAAWLRGPLAWWARDVLSPERVRRQGFFAPPAVTAVLERHVRGEEDLSRQLWGLIAFGLWLDRR